MEIKNYNNDILDDYYEVMSIIQDINGTLITLDGINNEVKIRFGAVDSICVTDEGSRIETYNNGKTKALNEYRLKNFYGNPFFIATAETDFTLWLKKESCGFCTKDLKGSMTLGSRMEIARDLALPQNAAGGYGLRPYAFVFDQREKTPPHLLFFIYYLLF